MRHVITLFDLAANEIDRIFTITEHLKIKYSKGVRDPLLAGKVLSLLFEKPSLRTRVSFESAMAHLGGSSMFLGPEVGWGRRESIADFTTVLSRYVDVIVCRANSHGRLEELATNSSCSVVNGLTDLSHPCQALADLYTLREIYGSLRGCKLAYVGDANNVARSLAVACSKLGVQFAIAGPPGYHFDEQFLEQLRRESPQLALEVTTDPREAVQEANGVYTDVWASMGQEEEHDKRSRAFAAYQVNAELMRLAPPDASFLHCLPARRGEEVTDEVIDGPGSVVVQQAENRMHVQKGLLAWLLGAEVAV